MAQFRERTTSLFDSLAQALVNPVNCVGVMGAGLAKEFKTRYPEMYAPYKVVCDLKVLCPGQVWSYVLDEDFGAQSVIICFPTKRHYREPSRLEDVAAGLQSLRSQIEGSAITSLAIPALGCGLGGLDWLEVRHLIMSELKDLDVFVELYPPK